MNYDQFSILEDIPKPNSELVQQIKKLIDCEDEPLLNAIAIKV